MRQPVDLFLASALALGLSAAAPRAQTLSDARLVEWETGVAKHLFERNIQAIIDRDRETYLSCYLDSPRLVRTSPEGFDLGFAGMAEGAPATGSDDWPELLVPSDVRVTWLAPGLVYGTYRYEVVIDGVRSVGLSERLFVKVGQAWKIAVTTAFPRVEAADDASPIHPHLATVQRFRKAKRERDRATLREVLSDDSRIWFDVKAGEGTERGLDGAGPWSRWDSIFNSKTEVIDAKIELQRVDTVVREESDWFRLIDRRTAWYMGSSRSQVEATSIVSVNTPLA